MNFEFLLVANSIRQSFSTLWVDKFFGTFVGCFVHVSYGILQYKRSLFRENEPVDLFFKHLNFLGESKKKKSGGSIPNFR